MNKDNIEKQLEEKLTLAKSVSLSGEEKERMKTFLSSYMDFNPVKSKDTEAKRIFVRMQIFTRFVIPAFAVVLFFVGSSVVMAEKSLPGDSLYSFKITVENVRSSLATSPESKARWNASRVERRLSEAQSLSSAGKLSPELAADLAVNLGTHSNSVESDLKNLRSKDKEIVALEIDNNYHSTVRMYKSLLSQLSEESSELIALLEEIIIDEEGYSPDLTVVAVSASEPEDSVAPVSLEESPEELSDLDSREPENDAPVEALALVAAESEEGGEIQPEADQVKAVENEDDEERVALSLKSEVVPDSEAPASATTISRAPDSQSYNLPIDTLETFVATRIEKTENSLKNTKLKKELRTELEERMSSAKKFYKSGQEARKSGDDDRARADYRKALNITADIGVAIRISPTVLQEHILKSFNQISSLESEMKKDIESKANKALDNLGL